jgi:hypothetical protein
MPSNGQSLQEGFLAVTAEEFVVGHTDLHSFEKGDGRILDPMVGRVQHGQVTNSAWFGPQIYPATWVSDFARFSGLELA